MLFGGKGKVSDLMGDVAKGIKSFKKGLADDEPATAAAEAKSIGNRPVMPPRPMPKRSRADRSSPRG
ncbi:MAG: hypothetical protein V9G18_12465 [Albidovulum sp.]